MKVLIRQVRGNSGVDVWAGTLCQGIRLEGHDCFLDLRSGIYQVIPVPSGIPGDSYDIFHGNAGTGVLSKPEIPLVLTEHHVIHDPLFEPYKTFPQKIFHRWQYRFERKALETADVVTCDSMFTGKKLEEVFGFHDAQLVYAGIDPQVFRPVAADRSAWNLPEDRTILFYSGNLSRRKGADLLPAIMKCLGDEFLLLVAPGGRAGLPGGYGQIRNLGYLSREQLVEAYNACDIFLTASRLEGFGLSVAEAMACGKPVVATDSSSLPELVIDGKGGFLCGIEDVPDFAEKIRQLAGDENLRREMGTFNRKRIEEQFTVRTMTKNFITLYNSLLS